jgi:hypothetical protein
VIQPPTQKSVRLAAGRQGPRSLPDGRRRLLHHRSGACFFRRPPRTSRRKSLKRRKPSSGGPPLASDHRRRGDPSRLDPRKHCPAGLAMRWRGLQLRKVEAVSLAYEQRPDLILADINLGAGARGLRPSSKNPRTLFPFRSSSSRSISVVFVDGERSARARTHLITNPFVPETLQASIDDRRSSCETSTVAAATPTTSTRTRFRPLRPPPLRRRRMSRGLVLPTSEGSSSAPTQGTRLGPEG